MAMAEKRNFLPRAGGMKWNVDRLMYLYTTAPYNNPVRCLAKERTGQQKKKLIAHAIEYLLENCV